MRTTLIRIDITTKRIIETFCYQEYKKHNPSDIKPSIDRIIKSMIANYTGNFYDYMKNKIDEQVD